MKQSKILVSVIVPTYNRGQSLVNTLRSLEGQIYKNFEIIVVDQSTKKFPEKENYLRGHREIRYFFLPEANASLAKNFGAGKARGGIFLFLDDDVIADKNLIAEHVKSYEDDSSPFPLVGAVAGRVIDAGKPSERLKKDTGRITPYGRFTDGFSSLIRQEVDTVITCNASWRRDIFEKLGGFDNNFTGPIREDSDLSLRTKKLGYRIIFSPKALVTHVRAATGGFRKNEGRLKWYRGFFKCETYFSLKYVKWYFLPIFWLLRWQYFLRAMFGFGREVNLLSLFTPLMGILDGIKTFQKIKKIKK